MLGLVFLLFEERGFADEEGVTRGGTLLFSYLSKREDGMDACLRNDGMNQVREQEQGGEVNPMPIVCRDLSVSGVGGMIHFCLISQKGVY